MKWQTMLQRPCGKDEFGQLLEVGVLAGSEGKEFFAAGKYNNGIIGSQGPRRKIMNITHGVTLYRSEGVTTSPCLCSNTYTAP